MHVVNAEPFSLAAPVANNGTVAIGYPSGFSQADFVGEFALAEAQIAVNFNDVYRESLSHVGVTYGASSVTIMNTSGQAWPIGSQILPSLTRSNSAGGGGGSGGSGSSGYATITELTDAIITAALDATQGPRLKSSTLGLLGTDVLRTGEDVAAAMGLTANDLPRVNATNDGFTAALEEVEVLATAADFFARTPDVLVDMNTIEDAMAFVAMTLDTGPTPDALNWNLSGGANFETPGLTASAEIEVPTMAAKHIGQSGMIRVQITTGTPTVTKDAAILGQALTGHPTANGSKFGIGYFIIAGPVCVFTGWVALA